MNTDLNSLKSLSNGVLTIGAVPILGQFGISRLINDFAAQFPKLALHVVEQEGISILKQLLTGDLDMALLRDTQAEVLSTREYVKLDLAKDELQVILAKTNPLAKRPSLSANDLAAITIVSLLSGSGVFEPMQAFLRIVISHPKSSLAVRISRHFWGWSKAAATLPFVPSILPAVCQFELCC